jgi:hypothetical protein
MASKPQQLKKQMLKGFSEIDSEQTAQFSTVCEIVDSHISDLRVEIEEMMSVVNNALLVAQQAFDNSNADSFWNDLEHELLEAQNELQEHFDTFHLDKLEELLDDAKEVYNGVCEFAGL